MEITEDSPENPDNRGESKSKNLKNRFRLNPQDVKEEREKRRRRRGRLIVRNISYKATDDTLRKHFEKFGTITDLNLLKRPDGKLVGCAFVQYEKVNDAAKAIYNATNKEFLGRPVYVDWALGKDEYVKQKRQQTQTEVKEEDDGIKKEENEEMEKEVKDESDNGVETDVEDQTDDEDMKSEEGSDEDDGVEDSEAGDSDEEDESGSETKAKIKKIDEGKQKRVSNDVKEGSTIFIKNVPFDATSDDLRECCVKFGPVYHALINTDPVSGHSKGTAFVKFKTKDSADLCLASGDEFVLLGSVMDPMLALSREEVRQQKNAASNKDPKDTRNLYLVKEGLIMAGSKAAEGVSASDMNKRHKLEQTKTQILKNLNRFVSRNRLSIHNLPFQYDDEKLRNMVIRYTGLKPHECRVMRENKSSVGHPRGKPKGFGFVSFKNHETALSALRKLNNNPKVFSRNARPIVGFSIEDRSVHKIKERRTQKSREANPTYNQKLEKLKARKAKKQSERKDNKKHIQTDTKTAIKPSKTPKPTNVEATDNFVGTAAAPGTIVRMRSGRKIKEQAQQHLKRVGDQKRQQKKRKEKLMHRIEKKQIDRPKMGKKKTDKDNFSLLVNKYKRMLDASNDAEGLVKPTKRSKWYSE